MLTQTQLQIIDGLCSGLNHHQIAEKNDLVSKKSVDDQSRHIKNIINGEVPTFTGSVHAEISKMTGCTMRKAERLSQAARHTLNIQKPQGSHYSVPEARQIIMAAISQWHCH